MKSRDLAKAIYRFLSRITRVTYVVRWWLFNKYDLYNEGLYCDSCGQPARNSMPPKLLIPPNFEARLAHGPDPRLKEINRKNEERTQARLNRKPYY
jgi:hypothetical protein